MVDNIEGSRTVSLYAGMTTVRSSELASSRVGKGSDFSEDVRERYVFSESRVTIGGGDHITINM